MNLPANNIISTSDAFIKKIADCISDAVGDDIQEDIITNDLITQNSIPFRIWDLINRNLCHSFDNATPTKRGIWSFVPIFDSETGTIYTIMRESRFNTLKKELPKRKYVHYLDAFVKALNADLKSSNEQLSIFEGKHLFENENQISDIIDKILFDLNISLTIVKRHALILLNTRSNQLISLKCYVLDNNFNLVDEADWSNYINVIDSTVVETINNTTQELNHTINTLKLKKKATDRIGQKSLTSIKTDRNKEKSNTE